MNQVLSVFLSMSLSGSILGILFLTLKPVLKKQMSQTWQYYIWLVVILRFLLPITPQVSVVGEFVQSIQNAVTGSAEAADMVDNYGSELEYGIVQNKTPSLHEIESETSMFSRLLHKVRPYAWLFWLNVALVLFVHKLVSYRSFVRFVRMGAAKVTDTRILDIFGEALAEAGIKRRLTLYQNEQVSSPMLAGIIRPMVVLPLLHVHDEVLRNMFRHEFVHERRGDFLYKWLVQIALCLHWFNPLIYLISRRISRSCELSCDEAVIKHMDEVGRLHYGDAIIASLEAQGSYRNLVVSITMSEHVNSLKERLDAIMNYRKQKKWTIVPAVMLAVVLSMAGYALGASSYELGSNVVFNLKNNEGQTNLIHSSSFEASAGQVLTLDIRSSIKGAVDLFLFSPSGNEQRITMTGSDDMKTVALEESGWWQYNCTGFFDSGDISIVGTISSDSSKETEEKPTIPDLPNYDLIDPVVIDLHNDAGQKNLTHSSSFEAKEDQVLTLEATSTINGTVDLTLFSPDDQQHRITFGGSDETKAIQLSDGRWYYNCAGFFDSGDIAIVGTIQ